MLADCCPSVCLTRSIDYSINGFYHNHVTVVANVVVPDLTLSTEFLEVGSTVGLPAEAGMRSTITLRNPLNYAASFTWYPVVGDSGTAFSIRPASGMYTPCLTHRTVNAGQFLTPDFCEISHLSLVWI